MSTQFLPNRIIKFRAWDKTKLKMYHWNPEFFYDTSPVTTWSGIFPSEDDNIILMQFTGLLDKNGQEMFEGDILATTGLPNVIIRFGKNETWIGWYCEYIGLESTCHFNDSVPCTSQIIGNIFDNPEFFSK